MRCAVCDSCPLYSSAIELLGAALGAARGSPEMARRLTQVVEAYEAVNKEFDITRGNSWFLRMEDKIGSIEPGKLADLAVLDRDYFSVPDAQINRSARSSQSSTARSFRSSPPTTSRA